MTSTCEPAASQNAVSLATASGSAPSAGVRMHQRCRNNVAKPASGPEYSVPATGWAGMKCTPSVTCGATAAMTPLFTEPTSERIAPALRCGAAARAASLIAPTGTQRMTRSAPATASAALLTMSPMRSSPARLRTSASASKPAISLARFCRRATCAIEEPIRPKPISAILSKRGVARAGPSRSGTLLLPGGHKFGERVDDKPVRLFRADRHAQTVGQSVHADGAQDEPARGEETVGIRRRAAGRLREPDQHEIGDAWHNLESELGDFLGEPGQPFRIMRDRFFDMRDVVDGRNTRFDGRRVDIERPADAVYGVTDMRRRVAPADAQRREPIDFGKRARHHDIVVLRREL